MESARYQQAERRGTRFYDMASVFPHRGKASLVLHGFFVLPASHIINPAPPILQPGSDIGSFADHGPDENLTFEDPSGSRAAPSNEDYGTDHEPVQYGALDANFEFDFDLPSQIEAGQGQGRMSQFTNPFTADFPPANPNEIFGNGVPGQEYNFPHSMDIPNVPSTMPETNISYNDYDQPTHHNPYSLNIPGQETTLSSCLETNFYEASFSQETSFSTTSTSASNGFYENYNQSDIFADPEQQPSSELETNPQDNQATHLPTTSTPSIPAPHTSPPSNPASPPQVNSSPISSSPDRRTCPHCPRTFKRLGDVKRHEKVHIPGQRRFHCGKAGCERRGRRGFYRRDKLRDHVKTVHGS